MSNYKIISDYMSNDKYRKSFNKLSINTFGLDFEEWFQKQLFYQRYICYSYVNDAEEIIANVSVNKMHLIVGGQNKRAIQIGTVMTDENYRNQGLAAALIKHVIEKYNDECDIIYLFANDSVLNFYPKLGFKKVMEYAYELDTAQVKNINMTIRKLNKDNYKDYKIIDRLTENRQPVSQALGVYKDKWPLMVYCLYMYRENLYYLEDKDVIVILNRENGVLHIFDVLSMEPISLDDTIEAIVLPSDKSVEFHFIPELNQYKVIESLRERQNDTLFVRAKDALPGKVLFPNTSHT